MDLLVPGIGEIIGGTARGAARHPAGEHAPASPLGERILVVPRPAPLRHRAACRLRLGFERMLMFVTGVSNIRDVIPFARTPGSAEF